MENFTPLEKSTSQGGIEQRILETNSPSIENWVETKEDLKNIPKFDREVAEKVLFICKNCNGPLVQILVCSICRKSIKRICVRCKLISEVNSHSYCKQLLSVIQKRKVQQ